MAAPDADTMARFGAYLLLVVLAVFPLASLGRPTALVDFRTVNFTGTLSEAVEWIAGEEDRVREGNDDHIMISIQSLFSPTGTDQCIDVDDINVVMKDCVAGKSSQLWYVDDVAIVHSNNACLDVCNGPDCHQYDPPLTQVIAWPCHGGANQQFTTEGNQLISSHDNHCLDVCNSNLCQPQYDVITFPCHSGDNQRWKFILGGYTGPPSQ